MVLIQQRKMKSRKVLLGGRLPIGGGSPVVVQTMCNTHTCDVEASVAQCVRLAQAGAELIRLTVPGLKEVADLAEIKSRLRGMGIDTPLVADVHFSSEIAIAAATVVEKVRINPGNFHKDFDQACSQLSRLIEVCKQHGTVLRIGLNHGSLGERITNLYGNTAFAMKEAAMEWLRLCRKNDFNDVVVSLKASNTIVMVDAYRLLVKAMEEEGFDYPVHVGVTEAGNGDSGRIKSAVAIATLLSEGIGDTIRVSLTEDPEAEIPVAAWLAAAAPYLRAGTPVPSLEIPGLSEHGKNLLEASAQWGPKLIRGETDTIELEDEYLADEILQACRKRFYRPEYVACPGCGRTMYNLEETFNEVKRRTSHLKGMVIAVMGCIVNGPGEMADADWGYVGEGNHKVTIYKGRTPLLRHVPESEAIDRLLEAIESDK